MNKRSPHELARLAVLGGHRCPVISRADWPNTFLRVYMEKLAKGWPANMAAVAGRRAQAIEDGTLINLGMFVSRGRPVLDWVGIRFPVAMTSTAYHDATGEGEGLELLGSDVITERVLYILGRLKCAIREHTGDDPTRVDFVCTLPWVGWPLSTPAPQTPATVALYAVVGPGDNAEPVITIMLPGED